MAWKSRGSLESAKQSTKLGFYNISCWTGTGLQILQLVISIPDPTYNVAGITKKGTSSNLLVSLSNCDLIPSPFYG